MQISPVSFTGCPVKFVKREPMKSSFISYVTDAVSNKLNGYTPVVLKEKDKKGNIVPIINGDPDTGKIGRKFINWIKKEEKDYAQKTSILTHSGINVRKYTDISTQKPIYKVVENDEVRFSTLYKEGKVNMIEQYDKKKAFFDGYNIYSRNSEGKLQKTYSGTYMDSRQLRESAGLDPDPFTPNAENIWNNNV